LAWFARAASAGHTEAAYMLGVELLSREPTQAIEWLRRAAEHGQPHAAAKLGEVYLGGDHVPQSYAEAARWFEKAAFPIERDFSRGPPPSADGALRAWWYPTYHLAYEFVDSRAKIALGDLLANGLGVSQDYNRAALLYRQAAGENFSEAAVKLGDLHARGLGVERDLAEAERWYRQAADAGDEIGMARLEALLDRPPRS
jgi:TPR repeat protein